MRLLVYQGRGDMHMGGQKQRRTLPRQSTGHPAHRESGAGGGPRRSASLAALLAAPGRAVVLGVQLFFSYLVAWNNVLGHITYDST